MNYNNFTNDYMESKYGTQTSVMDDILGVASASIVDIGTSAWNSLPGTEEVRTYDVLSKFSDNAANAYLDHQHLVQGISLVGGSIIPGMAAVKGMNALRAGTKGMSWFSHANKVQNLQKVDDAVRAGVEGTSAYRSAKKSIYLNGLANNTLDTAAAEVAIVLSMNGHPLMEDYMENPLENFGISMAFGSVLGGVGGLIADKYGISRIAAKAEQEAVSTALEGFTGVAQGLPDVNKLSVLDSGISHMNHVLSDNYQANGLTKEVAETYLKDLQVQRNTVFKDIISEEVAGSNPAFTTALQDKLSKDLRFAGTEKVGFFTVTSKAIEGKRSNIRSTIQNEPSPKVNLDANGNPVSVDDVVYLPEFDKFTTKEEALDYLRTDSVKGTLIDSVDPRTVGLNANTDTPLLIASDSVNSAYLDTQFKQTLDAVDSLKLNKLASTVTAEDDLFMLNAVYAKMVKEADAGVLPDNFKVKLRKSTLDAEDYTKAVLSEARLSATHTNDVKDVLFDDSLDLLTADISPEARSFVEGWANGNKEAVQKLATNKSKAMSRLVSSIKETPESQALRNRLAELADEEGYVYMYRLQRGKRLSHGNVETYSPVLNEAKLSGSAELYKVPVESVVGGISSDSGRVLVDSTRKAIKARQPNRSILSTVTTEEGNIATVGKALVKAKESAIASLLEKGVPPEVISIRTNTPLETVVAYGTSLEHGGDFLSMLGSKGLPLSTYSSKEVAEQVLTDSRKPLVLGTNANKLKFAELASKIDSKTTYDLNLEMMDTLGLTSNSSVYKDFHQSMFVGADGHGIKGALDILRTKLGELTNSNLGNSFVQSSDFFLRNTTVGPIISTVGKNVQNIATKATQRLTTPVVEAAARVSKSETAVIEANTAKALNDSLSGYREYRNRRFWQAVEGSEELVPAKFNGKEFVVRNDDVDALLKEMDTVGRELYELNITKGKVVGAQPMNDIGFWAPTVNPRDKAIAYVWNNKDNTTKLLVAESSDKLEELVGTYKGAISPEDRPYVKVVTKQEQGIENELWADLNQRLDPLTMELADVTQLKTGSAAPAVVKATTEPFNDLISAYDFTIESNVKQLAHYMMHDVTDTLDMMSRANRKFTEAQPFGTVKQALNNPKDGAKVAKNILLSNNNLDSNPFWQRHSANFETYTDWGIGVVSKAFSGVRNSLGKVDAQSLAKSNYEEIAAKLEAEGITNPFQQFDDSAAEMFGLASVSDHKNTTKRAVLASNAFAATFALRVLDLAQPIVNAVSLPILTHLAKAADHPSTFMGAKLGTTKANTAQIMHEGARLSNSSMGESLAARWEADGYFDSFVSEANKTLRDSRRFDSDIIGKIERGLDSKIVDVLSFGADKTEGFLRRQTMFTGAALAKRLYPELDDTGITIFARDFMDRAMGNYHAPQRPVMFQGTAGTALGLFQTYMLTMGQSIYRHLELKNYKELGKTALLQSSIFGTSSMPGFDVVSQAIGDHYSDENFDLTTGTFRAIDNDKIATSILYGLPSSIGPALYSRGDLQPRAINPISGSYGFAAANMVGQAVDFAGNVIQAANAEDGQVARSIGQAFALQSVSRPLARISEIATGSSITRRGNPIATSEEVWTPVGIASRLLSTRPIEEAKMREAIHMNTVYGQIDAEHKRKALFDLKTAIREDNLTDGLLATLADNYMRHNGSPRGWQAAVNNAIKESQLTGKEALIDKLKPDSPLMHMIDSLD